MNPAAHYALPMALVRITRFWPELHPIESGLDLGIFPPVIRDIVEESEDCGGALAYFLIMAVRTEALLRASVQESMTDTELARTAAEFIINGEIQRLNKRSQKNYRFIPFPIPEQALIHHRFSSGEFEVKEIYDFLEAMQPIAEKPADRGSPGTTEAPPAKEPVTREVWIDRKIAAQSHLSGMGKFYARNHYGRLADQMPAGTFARGNFAVAPSHRGEEFRRFFEQLHENKLIYNEHFTAVVELTAIELTETYFECDARPVRSCTEQPLEIGPWTFRGSWERCEINSQGRRLFIPYASFRLWPGAGLVKKVEALLDLGDFDLIQTLLWSDLPKRRTAAPPIPKT
jgi:hypothetical protein